jgi:hypothetical protein
VFSGKRVSNHAESRKPKAEGPVKQGLPLLQFYKMMLIAAVLAASLGCEPMRSSASVAPSLPAANHFVFDVGVVLDGQLGYFCIPFERLDLDPKCEVLSISSSCDCLIPSVVEIRLYGDKSGRAVLIVYEDKHLSGQEDMSAKFDFVPASLAVEVEVRVDDGSIRQLVINMLHSQLAKSVSK